MQERYADTTDPQAASQRVARSSGGEGVRECKVRDITQRVIVNRAMFYRHSQDKCDLLAQYSQKLPGVVDSTEG